MVRVAVALEIEHGGKTTRLPLYFESTELIIGRGDAAAPVDLDLTPFGALESGVSRQHAHLSRQTDGVYLTDHNSKNGTYLNGFPLEGGKPYRLRHDDEITFGQFRTVFRLIR